MDNERKVRFKSSKKLLKRDSGPLLKPDVMLITKDVMVPVKLPPRPGRRFPTTQNRFTTKFRIEKKAQSPNSEALKSPFSYESLADSYVKESLPQVSEIISEEKIPPRSQFCPNLEANEARINVYLKKKEAVALERQHFSLRSNSGIFEFGAKNIRDIESLERTEADKPVTASSRNSMSSFTNSAETRSCSSSKSLDVIEDSLPKLPIGIISSSEDESSIRIFDRAAIPPKHDSKFSVESNNSQNIVNDGIKINTNKNLNSQVGYEPNTLNSTENIEKKFAKSEQPPPELLGSNHNLRKREESCTLHDSSAEKLIINYEKACEDGSIIIDVEYLIEDLLTNLETVENNFDKAEKQSSQTFKNTGYNFKERIPKIVEFKYSLHNLGKTVSTSDDFNSSCDEQPSISYSWQKLDQLSKFEESETVYNNPDVNSNPSTEQMEIKYSWQIISDVDHEESINKEENSKFTSTEDLCLTKPKVQYSWQKLTSKYLADIPPEDNESDTNHPVSSINNVPQKTTNVESLKEYSSFGRTCALDYPLNKNPNIEKKSKDVERLAANSPLNNIISSMLPEMKLFNRRTSFNDKTTEIVGNYRDSYLRSHARTDSNKSSASYSSVSSIKHVLENLNEMVTSQKHMLDAYVKDHKLNQGSNNMEHSNTVERVEIFPSTLHVLGNYIVRDICPADMNGQRNLLDSSDDKTIQDHLLSDDLANEQNTRFENESDKKVSIEKIPGTIVTPAILDPDLQTRSNNSSIKGCSRRDSSPSSPPMSYDLEYYSRIFATDDNPSPKTKKQTNAKPGSRVFEKTRNNLLIPISGYDHTLTEKNWEQTIAEMEETVKLSHEAMSFIDESKDDGNQATPHTKSTGPLTPRVRVSVSETKEAAGDGKTRRAELLARLEAAVSRLKQSEQHLDANWNLDYSVLDIEESSSDKESQLPKEVETHIKDIVKSAEEYLAKLEEQLNDLRNADDQIINSSEKTFKEIDEAYQLFMDNLCQEINKRRNLVRLETEVLKYEGLAPLRACKQEVDAQIRSTQHLIVLTENMLSHPVTFNKERLGNIITASSHMGRIPAVPMPEELPYVTFSPPSDEIRRELVDRISCLGCVLRMGPAQFTEVYERPACLQLKWQIVDPEYASEEQTFIVQKAIGEVAEPTSSAFETVYVGPETTCFVRELPVDHLITLRVGIQVSDTAWSVHKIAQTSIPAYSWDMDNSDYLITNSGRIATKVTQNLSTLLSRSAQFDANYIIEFKFLEAVSGTDDEGVGLVFEPGGENDTLKRNGALLITPNGNIFMNGEQKLMQLPKIVLGTRIIFTSEPKDDDTLRMTIECANKAVTYDWTVQRPLHFAARFSEQNKWNLMVK